MIKYVSLLVMLTLNLVLGLRAQNYPQNYFQHPVNGVIQLSGTFAELRGNHFHSGIDIRTGGKEGLPVFAAADGYVVRIKVEPGGFGKALYINHPNGYTTVYAHLQKFNEKINDWTRGRQYEKESFAVDLFPPKGVLKVSKGEIIALSGNSGGSEGPHLHYEIRETQTEMPVNPILFGLSIKDFIRPTIHGLRVYPEGKNSLVNNNPEPGTFVLAGWGPFYRLKISDTINLSGDFSLGVSSTDLMNETSNRNGIVEYTVYIDSLKVFEWKAIKFSFSETRYINSFIDYSYYYLNNQRFMRTRIDPGNRLGMYSYSPDNGIFHAIPGRSHLMKVVLKDSNGNESILQFFINGKSPSTVKLKSDDLVKKGILFTVSNLNNYATPDMRISMPGNCLYDSIRFVYKELPSIAGSYSAVHSIHTPQVPLQSHYDLSIRVRGKTLADSSKLIVVRLNNENKPSSVGGKIDNGFMKVKLRDFGRYTVIADTLAPLISAVNFKENSNISKLSEIKVKISDNLSGISSYRGEINGKWILMDYDAKNRLLTYKKDAVAQSGNITLTVTVSDGVGNQSVSQWNLVN